MWLLLLHTHTHWSCEPADWDIYSVYTGGLLSWQQPGVEGCMNANSLLPGKLPPWQYWLLPLLASLTGLATPSPLRNKQLWKPSSLPYTAWYVWLIVVTIDTHSLGGWMKLQTIRSHSWLVLGRYELLVWWGFVYFHTWLLNGPEVALFHWGWHLWSVNWCPCSQANLKRFLWS